MKTIVFKILTLPPNVGEYDLKSFLRGRLKSTAKYKEKFNKIPSVKNRGDLIFGTNKGRASPARFYNGQVEFNKINFIRVRHFGVSPDELVGAFQKMLRQAGINYTVER